MITVLCRLHKTRYSWTQNKTVFSLTRLCCSHLPLQGQVLPSYHFPPPRPGLNLAQHLAAFYLHPLMDPAIEATSTPPPPLPNLSLCLFTARLHNSLARQSSKNSVCPITAAAPPPFYWCVRGGTVSEWVCVGLWAHCFSSSQKEVWLDRYGNLNCTQKNKFLSISAFRDTI